MDCPNCGSVKVRKAGFDPHSKRQRYKCNECKRQFTPKDASPALEAMVDTIVDDGANPDERQAPPRQQKAGPKKVLNKTSAIIGDAVAAGVMLVTAQPDARKNLTKEEAQSVGHPVVRMLARRVPDWVKPFLPKTKLSPEDAADLEEILATLARWSLRLVTLAVTDFMTAKEQGQAKRQQEQVAKAAPAQQAAWAREAAALQAHREMMSGGDGREEQARQREMAAAQTAPSPNGHNPAFDVLNNVDIGLTEG